MSFKIIKSELDLKNKQTEFSNEKITLKKNLNEQRFKTKLEKNSIRKYVEEEIQLTVALLKSSLTY
jgi:hypothetical protein